MYRKLSFLLLLLYIVSPCNSWASDRISSPSWWFVELKAGFTAPDIDKEFGGSATPYADVFGDGESMLFKVQVDFKFFKTFGSLAVGSDFGFFRKVGKALLDDGSPSEDDTALILIPLGIKLTYRFDVLSNKWNIPLVPYAKIGLNYTVWWITEGDNSIATFGSSQSGGSASGGTYGYEFVLGLSILLDFFDPVAAASLDNEAGINHSYIFAEYTWNTSDNFGGSNVLMVGGNYWLFGLGLEF
jgi:hypothetical protein